MHIKKRTNFTLRVFICYAARVKSRKVSPLNSKQRGLKLCLIEKHEDAQLLSLNVNGRKNDRQPSRHPGQDGLAKTYETHKETHTQTRVSLETQDTKHKEAGSNRTRKRGVTDK